MVCREAPGTTMYAGIDLAADAKRTGLAMVSGEVSSVISVAQLGDDDDAVVDAIAMADRAGIDVPLGWPDEFVRFIQAHASGDTERPERDRKSTRLNSSHVAS